jgi:hypothetical protein
VETDAAVEIKTPISTAAWKGKSTFHRFHRPLSGRRAESLIDAGHEPHSVLYLIVINTLPKGSIRFRFPFGRKTNPDGPEILCSSQRGPSKARTPLRVAQENFVLTFELS